MYNDIELQIAATSRSPEETFARLEAYYESQWEEEGDEESEPFEVIPVGLSGEVTIFENGFEEVYF